jgi:hypothetical protein
VAYRLRACRARNGGLGFILEAYSLATLRRFEEAAAIYDAVATRFVAGEDGSVQDIVRRSCALHNELKQSR